ncbi:MAG: tRNA lysidine(34) synthetase TilS [Acutalibacteraceae bacterium]
MICKVEKTIEQYKMLENVSSVAVGVSGGADSMCLLHILSKLKVRYDILLKAVHVNHHIRGEEAERDAAVVRDFCEKLGVEFLLFSRDIPALAAERGISQEECGREERYRCFAEANCDAVAVAHNLCDSAETAVFNLIRGTGSRGLCAMAPVREPNIIRPLIGCSREEIETYCRREGIDFVTDSTNLSDDYTRNYIRHHILPAFSRVNPAYLEHIGRLTDTLRLENDFLDESARNILVELEDGYSRRELMKAHAALRRRAIAMLLREKMQKSLECRHIELVCGAVEAGKGKIELGKDLYISVNSDIISFHSAEISQDEWSVASADGLFVTPVGVYRLCSGGGKGALDADRLKGELTMSSRRPGDRLKSGKRGNTKTLKKLFNEMKIPPCQRNSIAVLRDAEGHVVWVEGVGADAAYAAGKDSQNTAVIKKEG